MPIDPKCSCKNPVGATKPTIPNANTAPSEAPKQGDHVFGDVLGMMRSALQTVFGGMHDWDKVLQSWNQGVFETWQQISGLDFGHGAQPPLGHRTGLAEPDEHSLLFGAYAAQFRWTFCEILCECATQPYAISGATRAWKAAVLAALQRVLDHAVDETALDAYIRAPTQTRQGNPNAVRHTPISLAVARARVGTLNGNATVKRRVLEVLDRLDATKEYLRGLLDRWPTHQTSLPAARLGARSVVVLDPAHGGSTVMGRSTPSGARPGAQHHNLALCQWVREQAGGAQLTREGDYNLSLADRIASGRRARASAFVSVHCTDRPDTVVWVHEAADHRSTRLGERLARSLGAPMGRAQLAVLDPGAQGGTPAVLLEVGGGRGGGSAEAERAARSLAHLVQELAHTAQVLAAPAGAAPGPLVIDLSSADAYHHSIAALRAHLGRVTSGVFPITVSLYGLNVTLYMDAADLYIVGFVSKGGPYAVERTLHLGGGRTVNAKLFRDGSHTALMTAKSSFDIGSLYSQLENLAYFADTPGQVDNAAKALGVIVSAVSEAARFHSVEAAIANAITSGVPLPLAHFVGDRFTKWQALTKANDPDVAVRQDRPLGVRAQTLAAPAINWNAMPDVARAALEARGYPVSIPASGHAGVGPVYAIHAMPSADLPAAVQELVWGLYQGADIIDQSNPHTSIADNTLGAMRSWHANQHHHLPDLPPFPADAPARAQAYRRYARTFKTPAGVPLHGGARGYVEYSLGQLLGAHGRLCFDFVNNRVFLSTQHYGVWDNTTGQHQGQNITAINPRFRSPWIQVHPITQPATHAEHFFKYDPRSFQPTFGRPAAPPLHAHAGHRDPWTSAW